MKSYFRFSKSTQMMQNLLMTERINKLFEMIVLLELSEFGFKIWILVLLKLPKLYDHRKNSFFYEAVSSNTFRPKALVWPQMRQHYSITGASNSKFQDPDKRKKIRNWNSLYYLEKKFDEWKFNACANYGLYGLSYVFLTNHLVLMALEKNNDSKTVIL